jgi:hypothetical protein
MFMLMLDVLEILYINKGIGVNFATRVTLVSDVLVQCKMRGQFLEPLQVAAQGISKFKPLF